MRNRNIYRGYQQQAITKFVVSQITFSVLCFRGRPPKPLETLQRSCTNVYFN